MLAQNEEKDLLEALRISVSTGEMPKVVLKEFNIDDKINLMLEVVMDAEFIKQSTKGKPSLAPT